MADVHFGKRTATYDPEVCQDRLTRLGDKLAGIQSLLAGTYRIDKLVVCLLGDLNDGGQIFAGQEHYQAITNVEEQAWTCAAMLSDWATRQRGIWRAVEFECVPGNHGRAGKFAHLAASWDIVAYKYLASKATRGVTVKMNTEGDPFIRMIDIRGHRYLLHHGHLVRSYMGVPWYGISRRLMSWATTTSLAGFDVAMFGHFHQLGDWHVNALRFLSTGTIVTGDDWALQALGAESPPAWWLFGVGDDRPVTWQFALDLI